MNTPAPRVLVADDDRAVRTALQVNLSKAGYDVTLVSSAEQALETLRGSAYDVLLTDVKMPGMGGMELLGEVRTHWPDVRVVVMTGFGSVRDAVAAMKAGAADYIIKPIERDELLLLLERALQTRAMQRELQQLRKEVEQRYGFSELIGISPPMREVYEEVTAVADSSALVLIQGETGTGKELIAHAIHYRSGRASAPLVAVNCGALPENLLESELFGHERGAFTGAVRQHQGKFEQADGGTLFLDEIGEIPPAVQVRLLRVLEGGIVTRVGGEHTVKVNVRVIAATNRDLWKEVQTGGFRADLYYRLNVFPIRLPSLADRRDDIPLLVEHFARKFAARHNRPVPTVSANAMKALQGHGWPGNVRELEHFMERLVLLSNGGEINSVRLPESPLAAPSSAGGGGASLASVGPGGLPVALEDYERALIAEALREAGGVQARAARRLGISRSNLNYRIGRLGLTLQDIRFGVEGRQSR
ncbi:MAG: sigma-54 dependent transcriptional regulator [Pseudomonadota bacterium]|nr:sigma-54 dependent transcriptional regulator [Pseudomonadota bacterium]